MSKLTVHKRLHLTPDRATFADPFVRCPTDRAWASRDTCKRCPDSLAEEARGDAIVVLCAKAPSSRRDPARTLITEAMDPEVLTVSPDAPAGDIAQALDGRNLAIAVIVDENAHPIGVCSLGDLRGKLGGKRADAIMTPFVITLLSNATVSDAVDTILDRGLHHIPILADGRIVGVVSSGSALQWLAQNLRPSRRARAHLTTMR